MPANDDILHLSRTLNKIKIPPHSDSFSAEIIWFQHQFFRLDGRRMNRKPHRHSFYEVHFPVHGYATYCFADGKECRVEAGSYLLIPPRTEHTFVRCDAEYEKFSFAFSISEEAASEAGLCFPTAATSAPITAAFSTVFFLAEEIVRREDGRRPFFLRDVLSALILLLSTPIRSAKEEPRDKEDVRLGRAKDYIRDNRMCAVSTEEVAACVHLSKRQLDRLFEKEEHVTTAGYIRRIRCEAAKELLIETGLSLFEIADRLGFSNEYNFIRFFKHTEGFTPGEFRRAVGINGR